MKAMEFENCDPWMYANDTQLTNAGNNADNIKLNLNE